MAKRRAHPKVNFDPSKRLPQPTSPVKLDIEGAIARRRSQIASAGHTKLSPAAKSPPISGNSVAQVLRRPGELEKLFKSIAEGFRQADLAHRAGIDQQVAECFSIATFLKRNWRGDGHLLGTEWVKFWEKHGRSGDTALRFVFKKAHHDAKKASFYYRATRKLFEEGVSGKNLPARITAEGGYQELADKNVKQPRKKTPTKPDNDEYEAAAGGKEARGSLHTNRDAEQTSPAKGKLSSTSAAKRTSAEHRSQADIGDHSRLTKVTASEGVEFFALRLPCSVTLEVELSQDPDGQLLIHVIGMKQIE